MEKQKMGGVVFPLVTPFCGEDEHVNYPALDKLIDFLIENGATGVIPCGSTGELVSMPLEEQLEINRHTIEYVNIAARSMPAPARTAPPTRSCSPKLRRKPGPTASWSSRPGTLRRTRRKPTIIIRPSVPNFRFR